MLPLKIYANVKCCHEFMANMDVGMALVQIKYGCRHGFGADKVLMWLYECWHDFGANEVLTWLHECWHGFNTNEVLLWLHGKDECWHDFSKC